MRFRMLLLMAIVLTSKIIIFAADDPAQSQAIREIERLGGVVERDDKLPGRPVTGIHFPNLSNFGDEHLTLLKPLTKLTNVWLNNTKVCGTRIRGGGLRELRTLSSLTTLNLFACKISDSGMSQLAELRNLRYLDLQHTQITDVGLKELKQLKNLETLDLGSDRITDAGLRELGGLKKLSSLTVDSNQITDAGLVDLKELTKLANLKLQHEPGHGRRREGTERA